MKKRQKGWFFPPQKPPKHKVPENVKIEVELTGIVTIFTSIQSIAPLVRMLYHHF